jgi:hypothetical protein
MFHHSPRCLYFHQCAGDGWSYGVGGLPVGHCFVSPVEIFKDYSPNIDTPPFSTCFSND